MFYFVFQSLNELLETADAPFEVITGYIQTITLTVPWAALVQENCALEVKGLEMVFRQRPRVGKALVQNVLLQVQERTCEYFSNSNRKLMSLSHVAFYFSIWQ